MLSPADVDAYLVRLGVDAEPPSVPALVRLHAAHVERVAYETLWIQLGEGWTVDPLESARRIAHGGRGGYCFHLNGGLAELLEALGYRVERHVGGVHGPDGPSEDELTNHLVLTVHDLPTADHPSGTWYVDAGLGDALHEPFPLAEATHVQGPFTLGLEATSAADAVGDWHLTHDAAGSFAGMAWRSASVGLDAFATRHAWLSTAPESGFVRFITVQRREADVVDMLRGLTLRRLGTDAQERTIATRSELLDCLTDQFGLDLSPIPGEALDTLWRTAKAAHESWLASRQP